MRCKISKNPTSHLTGFITFMDGAHVTMVMHVLLCLEFLFYYFI